MKRFDSGEALAKEIGCKPEVLKKTCELEASRQRTQAHP